MKPTLAIYGIKDRNTFDYPAYVHDHSICLMQDGEILQYLPLERYTKRKYDNRLDLFVEQIIDDKIIDLPEDFDLVCVNDFVGNSFVSKNGRLRFEADYQKELSFSLLPAHGYFQYDGWSGREVEAFLCQHEVAHICSTLPFYGDFQDNSLLFSLDGGSSLGNYSAFLFRNGKFQLIANGWDELGYVSKFFNDNSLTFKMLGAHLGEHCSVPGKLMGFASWGHYDEKIARWLVKNQYFKEFWNHEDEILKSIKENFGVDSVFDTHHKFMQDIAATFQRIFEDAVLQKLENLQHKFHCDNLYYGGGCALNIVTNTKIVESGMFRKVYIAPCCNDSGLSIGAAAFLERQKGNTIKIHSPYLVDNGQLTVGNAVDNVEIERVAEMLLQGKIIGICNGKGEAGPRALGNRSLIALANSRPLAQKLSTEVKKREWYRPVAPIMLKENAEKVTAQQINHLANFMLMDFVIKSEYRDVLQGVVHANNTARIQVLESENENPFMYRLLKYLSDNHGVMALINTSFNAQGEPIVHTTNDAIRSARKMQLDALVVNCRLSTANCQFKNKLKYHAPGIAPVEDDSGWYHVDTQDNPIYSQRYRRTFGYYDGLAAVTDFGGNCYHIDTQGKRIYAENYAFCGNYQEQKCVVRDFNGDYFHIDINGKRLYPDNYRYVGDYKDGFACVKCADGLFRHIDAAGNLINGKGFNDLGVFHKGFATAKDDKGWFHIDVNGNALYTERYAIVEPFYNGFALVTDFAGIKLIINEKGKIIRYI